MYYGERFNSLSHLLGLVLASAGSTWLVTGAIETGSAARIVGTVVFSVSAILLYLASTLYHSTREPAKRRWQRMDHCAIYLLIAGTATPFIISPSMDWIAWLSVLLLWLLAGAGVFFECRATTESAPSVWIYVGLGWAAVFSVFQEWTLLSEKSFILLLCGAVFYTAGTLFYRVSNRVKHAHGMWHMFVLMGTMCHYFSIEAHVL
ncbi:PAQR family membrane homeostasis protein TrhA [Kerstersia similis]|uniref:PAQR family membrane homeostasis protein TrhA n=1 Tax=Kerstersia similis TaxID=206505 RepID=UPI0039EE183D